jgi:hypothetical protein
MTKFWQIICSKGHYTERANMLDEVCPICGNPIVWIQFVDKTQGEWEDGGRIDGFVELKKTLPCKVLDKVSLLFRAFGINIFYVDQYQIPKNQGFEC